MSDPRVGTFTPWGSVDQLRLEIVCQRTGLVLVRNKVGVLSQAEGREPNAAQRISSDHPGRRPW